MRLSNALFLVIGALAGPSIASDATDMDQLVASYVAADQFMGTVLVAEGDKVLLNKGYGYANLELKVPNTPDTRIRIGSITKHFTAVAILLLEQRGKLRTSDPVKKYIPTVPAAWKGITIHHLVTHTSGIADTQNLPDFDPYSLAKPAEDPEKVVPEAVKRLPLLSKPGERYEYSNTNYTLLGYIIGKASGMPYEAFVTENLLKPLGMNDSGFDRWQTILPNRASGYAPTADGLRNAHFIDMTQAYAAGSLYSTAADMFRWQQGLYGGRLLTASMLKKMTTPEKDGYAYGVGVQEHRRGTVYTHSGGLDGFDTIIGYWPSRRISVVVLANRNAPTGPIAAGLSALAYGEKTPLFQAQGEQSQNAAGK